MSDKTPLQPSPHQQGESERIIDWSAIHRRLEKLRAAIEEEWRPGEAQVRDILSARAQRLAQAPAADVVAAQFEMLEFSLGRERYGIAAADVREVHSLNDFTPVPCTPGFVIGVANVRGEIISLLDIRRFFGIDATGITDLNKVIVIAGGGMVFGIVVDSIAEVRPVINDTLSPPAAISGIDARYLLGITSNHVAVLDAQALLRDKTLIVDEGG
jgi:purine-binding chemotaxis protein CheW